MIVYTLGRSEFHDMFRDSGRGGSFSYEALNILFDYFEEQEDDYHLDVVAVCSEYEEADFDDLEERLVGSGHLDAIGENDHDDILEALQDLTFVVGSTGNTVVFESF